MTVLATPVDKNPSSSFELRNLFLCLLDEAGSRVLISYLRSCLFQQHSAFQTLFRRNLQISFLIQPLHQIFIFLLITQTSFSYRYLHGFTFQEISSPIPLQTVPESSKRSSFFPILSVIH